MGATAAVTHTVIAMRILERIEHLYYIVTGIPDEIEGQLNRYTRCSGLLLLLPLLALSACKPGAEHTGEASAPPAAERRIKTLAEMPAGHRRMVELLAEVATAAKSENPFIGEARTLRMRKELEAVTPEYGIPRTWLVRIELAKQELRIGNEAAAIEHYEEANRLMQASESQVPLDKQLRTLLETGVAYMRVAESKNCVAHHTSDSCIFPITGGGVHVDPEASSNAARYFERAAKLAPQGSWPWIKARWLLNIAHMTLGSYPAGVPQRFLIPPSTFDSEQPFPRFKEIAPQLGLSSFDLAGGAVVEDFDGDELLDIVVSTWDAEGQMRYYRNSGDGRFEERTAEAGLTGLLGGLNMIHADYDNDGDPDLLVLRGGWWRRWGTHPNSLLRNEGDGSFVDVTFDAGLGGVHYPTQTAGWADYDADGDLDLYVGNETDLNVDASVNYSGEQGPHVRAPSQLFRNNGDGTFTDVASAAGVENLLYAKGVSWGDYDNDGDPDLFVSNMGGRNRLYRNEGDGSFTDVAQEAGLIRPFASFGAWFWDVNHDGALDLFVTSYGGPRLPADVGSVAAGYLGMANPGGELARLYIGDGKGGFTESAQEWGLTRPMLPMGANFGDLDGDGYLDFYLGTGYPYYDGLVPNEMFRNVDGRRFANVTTAGGFGHLQKGHGVVFADLDNDGDQDLFEQIGGAYPGDAFGNALFENPGFDGHWVKLRLIGRQANRSAIGARIRIEIDEASGRRQLTRELNSGGSFGSNPLRREIGLGSAERIALLEVSWPGSGAVQQFENLDVDRMYEIVEGQRQPREVELPSVRFSD